MPQLVLSSGYTWGFGLQQIEGESVFKNIFRVVTSFEKEICESVCEREREMPFKNIWVMMWKQNRKIKLFQ